MSYPKTIKDALHNTIHRHPRKSVAAIAEELEMSENYLYRSALPDPDDDQINGTGCRFPLKRLIPLIRATGDYQVLDFIERELGRVAISIPDPGGRLHHLHKEMARTVAEFGNVMRQFEQIVADDRITNVEAREFGFEAYQAVKAIVTFAESVKRAAK